MGHIIALFGESERGDYKKAHFCQSLIDLANKLGEPPSQESQGLEFAIQALLFQRDVIYFRVHEEGFSTHDYIQGFNFLEDRKLTPQISAICLPGVGSPEIIEATEPLLALHKGFLIVTEKDLYDYLTSIK